MVDDSQAWQRALNGDGRAFSSLFHRHRPAVVRQLWRFLASAADVDDATAVVFLEAWRRRESVRLVDGSMLPWLLVTANYTASTLRRGSRRYRAALERLPVVTEWRDPGLDVEEREVRSALRRLPLAEQQVLTLCALEGYSERDAAAALGVPPGTVKSRLHRARKRLAAVIEPPSRPMDGGVTDGH